MQCSECQDQLSDYVDNLLERVQHRRVERHLGVCSACRGVRDDIRKIVDASRALPAHVPSSALWRRVRRGIEPGRPRNWWRAVSSFEITLRAPQLALAAGLLVVLFSAAWLALAPEREVVSTGREAMRADLVERAILEIEQRISRLESGVESRRVGWNDELRATFDRQMLYIDQSLAECRHGLAGRPNDDVYQELMLGAYREKVRLLEEFSAY